MNTAEAAGCGRCLFFDKRLSTTGEIACASCHVPELAYSDARPVSVGVNGQLGNRRAPTVLNSVFNRALFWDGRAEFLVGQASQPLVAAKEHGNQTLGQAFGRIARSPGYQKMFLEAFGHEVNVADGLTAIAAFERTLVSSEAPIDRFTRGETWVFDKQQRRGADLFFSSGCTDCHSGKNFTDGQFHEILGATRDRTGQFDIGRGKITRDRADNFKFKTSTLRDIGRRAPYGHAGQFKTMADMVRYLNNPVAEAQIAAQGWTERDEECITKFLETAFESYHYPLVTEPELPR